MNEKATREKEVEAIKVMVKIKKETSWSLLLEEIIDDLTEASNGGSLEYTLYKAFRLREVLEEEE